MLNVARSSAVSGIGDPELLAMAADGNADAFDALLSGRLDRLYRMAFSITRSEADARDATQTACVQAWRELPRLRDREQFEAWLTRILVNRCRTMLRHRRVVRLREIGVALDDDQDPARPRIGYPEPAASTSHPERLAASDGIRRAFARLSGEARALIVLHHLEERPVLEIAALLGVPEGTVKWRLHAARAALERALEIESR
jgi:RNA polymerase sigma-70 factor (ECF subfamily)